MAEDVHRICEMVIREAVEIKEMVTRRGERHNQLEGLPGMMIEPTFCLPRQV